MNPFGKWPKLNLRMERKRSWLWRRCSGNFRSGVLRWSASLATMHRKDDFADHMTLGEALMRLVSPGEGIAFGNRNSKPRGLHRSVEALEFLDTVIADQGHAARFFGAGSTPLGCATRPPGRSTFRQRSSASPPASASTASTPSGAKRGPWS